MSAADLIIESEKWCNYLTSCDARHRPDSDNEGSSRRRNHDKSSTKDRKSTKRAESLNDDRIEAGQGDPEDADRHRMIDDQRYAN